MSLQHIDLKTSSPCTEHWQSMRGDARSRHCDLCAKTVHNLSAMTSKEVEQLALKALMGEAVCARITRRRSDESLVILPVPATRSSAGASVLLTAAMLCGVSAGAQENKAQAKATAVLTGRLMPAPATPNGLPITFARGLRLEDLSGRTIPADVQSDGSFSVAVPPGTYNIIAKNNFWHGVTVRSAVLHEGVQAMGDIEARENSDTGDEYITAGEVVSVPLRGYWVRHPVAYVRYVGRRIRMKLSQ